MSIGEQRLIPDPVSDAEITEAMSTSRLDGASHHQHADGADESFVGRGTELVVVPFGGDVRPVTRQILHHAAVAWQTQAAAAAAAAAA